MLGWLLKVLLPGHDWRGRMTYFRDRAPDLGACGVEGVDADVVEQVLDMTCHAFLIPTAQRHCLRPDDELIAIYRSTYRAGEPDTLEFETFQEWLEEEVKRPLTPDEGRSLTTVGDVMRFVQRERERRAAKAPTAE